MAQARCQLFINEAACRSGLSAKTIRYYESIGLIARPVRKTNRYREFSDRDISELQLLARARRLGFSVRNCSTLMSLYRARNCRDVDFCILAAELISDLDCKLRDLQEMRSVLKCLTDRRTRNKRRDTRVFNSLEESTSVRP